MTRKEAKLNKVDIEHLSLMIKIATTEDIANDFNHQIDKIYDDIESRTCENCKYKYIVSHNCIECRNDDSMVEYLDLDSFPKFGCNEFERKIG